MKKRNILLVEPDYKNKYPPIGLMKLATYHKQLGDNVKFYKGNLKNLILEEIYIELQNKIFQITGENIFNGQKETIIKYIKTKKVELLDVILNKNIEYKSLLQEWFNYYSTYYKTKKYKNNPKWDRICITTLFTFHWKKTIETIEFSKDLVKQNKELLVGGIMASVIPEEIEKATNIKPFSGLLNKSGILDKNKIVIDDLPLDYSILDEIDYKYPESEAYYSYMSRGCVNNCKFCAVPKIEPKFKEYISIKKKVQRVNEIYGEQRNLLLLDNNVLASNFFEKIIKEIKSMGFVKGALFKSPNYFEIAIKNLKIKLNDKAYIRKIFFLLKDLLENRVKGENEQNLYDILDEYQLLKLNTVTKINILNAYNSLSPIYEEFRLKSERQRYVDFNQGVDARHITENKMKLLSEIPIRPLRIAFDNIKLKDKYVNAVKLAAKYNIKILSNYLLYNFDDKPIDLYKRLKLNIYLAEQLKINIYSFPMKYIPIYGDVAKNREFTGKYWNKKFIRAIQAVLNSTKGKVGRGKSFFKKAFGATQNDFFDILYMPETYIIYRFFFEEIGYTQKWYNLFHNVLSSKELREAKKIIEKNNFENIHELTSNKNILELLKHYQMNRNKVVKKNGKYVLI